MSGTPPDYSSKGKTTKVISSFDLNELAARTGALSLLDRRGNTVWYDDFEAAAAKKWSLNFAVDGSAAVSTDRAWMGNQSMKTVTDTGPVGSTNIAKSFCLAVERKIAVEIMFCITAGEPFVDLNISGYTGTNFFQARVLYDHLTKKLYYSDSTATLTELPRTDDTEILNERWLFMKLVMDWDTKKYIRFIFCSTEYDLSNISIFYVPNASDKHLDVQIYNTAPTVAPCTVYFDNFILTQNEK